MKKLTIKWKFFLVINYLLLVLNILSLIAFVASINKGSNEPIVIYFLGIVFLVICIASALNIYIINRFFPDNLLTSKTARFLNIIRILMILVTVLLLSGSVVGIYVSFDRTNGPNTGDILGIIYFALLFLLCLFINILQFQIPRYLINQNAGNINQLIDSIGK
jgi:hypothetical protein